MHLRALFTDDRAVSPVIGAVMLVAMTVIFGTSAGVVIMNLSDQMSTDKPRANFEVAYENFDDGTPDNDKLTVRHGGGNSLATDQLGILVDDDTLYANGGAGPDSGGVTVSGWSSDTISVGDELILEESSGDTFEGGEDIRVIWQNPNRDTTQVLGTAETPN